jgi:hypothetical protein
MCLLHLLIHGGWVLEDDQERKWLWLLWDVVLTKRAPLVHPDSICTPLITEQKRIELGSIDQRRIEKLSQAAAPFRLWQSLA